MQTSTGAPSSKGKRAANELEVDEDEPRRYKKGGSKLTVADSMVEQAKIAAQSKKDELLTLITERQRYYEADLKQRDQHYTIQALQHQELVSKAETQRLTQEESLLRLKMDLEAQKNRRIEQEPRRRRDSNSSDT